MKKHIVSCCIALMILFLANNKVNAQPSIECQLINLNLAQFINKPIDSLLAKIPAGYTRLTVTSGCSVFLAGGIAIRYPTCDIDIRAYDFQYVTVRNINRVRPAEAWPIHLMRKEKIASIIIYKDWAVINSAGE